MTNTNATKNDALASKRAETRREEFEDSLYVCVKSLLRLWNPNVLEETALVTTEEWARSLFGVIPEKYLLDVKELAIKNHKTTFAVTFFEFKLAWEEIEAELLKAKRLADDAAREQNPVNFCVMKNNHLNEKGSTNIFIGDMATGDDYVVPCAFCLPVAHAAKIENIKRTRGEPDKTNGEIALEMFAAAKAKTQKKDVSNLPALELVAHLETLIGREAIAASGTDGALALTNAKNFMNRVWHYLKNQEAEGF